MPLQHDVAPSAGNIFDEVQTNLYDSQLKFYTSLDIYNSMQDAYNQIFALMSPLEQSTFIPQIASPYYDLSPMLNNYMYLVGVFNPATNLWLENLSYKQMKATYQTYLAIGQPKWFSIVDLTKLLIWPYDPGASGVLYVIYKPTAPTLSVDHIIQLPLSTGSRLVEYWTTADLLEQAREFGKAKKWWDRIFQPQKNTTISIFDQCVKEIRNLAASDRERVLEPYRWIFHGGQFLSNNWISNETPSGTVDGVNAVFTLAKVPNPTASLLLIDDGQVLFQGTAYTLNGQTITFESAYIPVEGAALRAWYQVS